MKTFKNYFDKIYCLSYVEAQNRRDYVTKQLTELNLVDGLEFNYGMPFNKIRSMRKQIYKVIEESCIPSLNIGGFGCAFNHYSAIKTAYETGANSVLIMEDDVLFLKNRETIIEYMDNIPNDWDYLYFTPSFVAYYDYHDLLTIKNSNDKFINLKNLDHGKLHWNLDYEQTNCWMSACAYALNRKAMNMYIVMFENSHRLVNADFVEYFFHNIIASPLVSYTTNIRLFAQPQEMNSITFDDETQKFIINGKSSMVASAINVTSDNFFTMQNDIRSLITQ